MHPLCLLLLLSTVYATVTGANDVECKGCVSLDEYSYRKLTAKFKTVLMKFDEAYPYGDKHSRFLEFASEQAESDDLLVAEVGVKDYGEPPANKQFAESFGVDPKKLPVVVLVNGGKTTRFDGEFTLDALRRFVSGNSDIYVSMPGCVKEFDEIALSYASADKKERKKLLDKARRLEDDAKEINKDSAKVYVKYMQKIDEQDSKFVKVETERLQKLLKGKLSDKKKDELNKRVNIISKFKIGSVTNEEL